MPMQRSHMAKERAGNQASGRRLSGDWAHRLSLAGQRCQWGTAGTAGQADPWTPAKPQESHLGWLAALVRDTTALQHRLEFALHLARSTVGRAMQALGFTPQRPLRRARERHPVLAERWQTEASPAAAAQAKRVGAVIVFSDEAGMRSDHHAGTTWSPLGRAPTVATTGRSFGTTMLCAVAPTGALHFMLHDGQFTAEVLVAFLRRLLHDAKAPVFLVLDGHRIHTAKRVQDFLAAQGGRLRLFFRPADAPHLNPDEQVWGNVKARVEKRTVTDKPDRIAKLTAALERLCELPQLIAGCFRHPHCASILRALASA